MQDVCLITPEAAFNHQWQTFVLGTGLYLSPSFVASPALRSGHKCSFHLRCKAVHSIDWKTVWNFNLECQDVLPTLRFLLLFWAQSQLCYSLENLSRNLPFPLLSGLARNRMSSKVMDVGKEEWIKVQVRSQWRESWNTLEKAPCAQFHFSGATQSSGVSPGRGPWNYKHLEIQVEMPYVFMGRCEST